MQWLFELSVACALIALASAPLLKFIATPAQRLRRPALRGAPFWLDMTPARVLAKVPTQSGQDARS